MSMVTFDTVDKRNGSPFDRGSSDRYYDRAYSPHYYVGKTYQSERIFKLTPTEIEEYKLGYDTETDRKDWGYDD